MIVTKLILIINIHYFELNHFLNRLNVVILIDCIFYYDLDFILCNYFNKKVHNIKDYFILLNYF